MARHDLTSLQQSRESVFLALIRMWISHLARSYTDALLRLTHGLKYIDYGGSGWKLWNKVSSVYAYLMYSWFFIFSSLKHPYISMEHFTLLICVFFELEEFAEYSKFEVNLGIKLYSFVFPSHKLKKSLFNFGNSY